jgi:hypothetical protein
MLIKLLSCYRVIKKRWMFGCNLGHETIDALQLYNSL